VKAWVLIPLVFLAGLVIGGLQPRGELRRLRQELETRKKVERTAPPQERQLASFLSMLPMDAPRADRATASAAYTNDAGNAATQIMMTATGLVAESGGTNRWQQMTAEERKAAFQARLDQAAEVWLMRAEVARGTFAAKTGFTDLEMTDFDVLMGSMNIRLLDLFKQTAEQIEAGGEFTPESGIRLMNGLTQAMVMTYDEMDRKLPATWRTDAGASFDLVTYVDPKVAQPLVGVQDKMPRGGEMRRNRFGGDGGPFRP
jgi:hypothetical protein